MRWDPHQYGRYASERARPFLDLVGRIGAAQPRAVVDLGCGPGTLTALLAERWPEARVEGIDSSPDMIAAAQSDVGSLRRATPSQRGQLSFELGDVADWAPAADVDVIVSNATLQW